MKSRHANEEYDCPLFKKKIYWSMCIEVQEVREDNMDMDLFPEPFDIDEADEICGKCRWYIVND